MLVGLPRRAMIEGRSERRWTFKIRRRAAEGLSRREHLHVTGQTKVFKGVRAGTIEGGNTARTRGMERSTERTPSMMSQMRHDKLDTMSMA